MLSKIIYSTLSVVTIFSFSGCGSDSSDNQNLTDDQSTVITVERGATYDANVTDANGQVAIQENGKNRYIFATSPKYPVTVNGGWIDVDGNGQLDINDTLLTTTMKSYSNIVTPITTYIADDNESIRNSKLTTLANLTNIDKSELEKVASQANTKAILTINAVYQEMIDQNTTNITTNDILSTLNLLESNVNLSGISDPKLIAQEIEKQTISNLLTKGKIVALSMNDLDEIQRFNLFGITWKNRKKDDYAQRSYKDNTVKIINDEIIMTAKKRIGGWSSRAELRARLNVPIKSYKAKVIIDSMSNDYGKAQINAYFKSINYQDGSWKQLQTSISIKDDKIWYGIFKETNNIPYIEIDSKIDTQSINTFKNVLLSCSVKLVDNNIIFNVKDLTNNIEYEEQTFDLSNEPLWNEMDINQKQFSTLLVRSVFDDRIFDNNKTDYTNTVMKLVDLSTSN